MRRRSEAAAEKLPEEARRVGEELVEEMRRQEVPARIEFDSAHRAAERPLDPGVERIVETIFIEDTFRTYKYLEDALALGEQRTDHGSVVRALDEAEKNCRLANRLWHTAKVELARWELDNEVVFGAMKIEATKILQLEKKQGDRNKAITDADVVAQCAVTYPDEWKAQEVKRRRVESAVKSLEHLNEVWLSRCRGLQSLLAKQR